MLRETKVARKLWGSHTTRDFHLIQENDIPAEIISHGKAFPEISTLSWQLNNHQRKDLVECPASDYINKKKDDKSVYNAHSRLPSESSPPFSYPNPCVQERTIFYYFPMYGKPHRIGESYIKISLFFHELDWHVGLYYPSSPVFGLSWLASLCCPLNS